MGSLLEKLQSGVLLRLILTAGDKMAEVMVIDGELKAVARDVGYLTVKLHAGVYKIKQRLGDHVSERVIFLNQDGQEESFDPLETGSAVPLSSDKAAPEGIATREKGGTAERAETLGYDPDTWRALCFSVRSPKVIGDGIKSEISMFFRLGDLPLTFDETSEEPIAYSYDLLDGEGGSVLDGPLEIRADDLDGGCYSLTVRVNPGPHYLTLFAASDTSLIKLATQQMLFASPKWQTRIYGFLLPLGPMPKTMLQIDSERISINMAKIDEAPTPQDMRLIETARQAMIAGQHVDFADQKRMLVEKFSDPVLGLLAAHIILQNKDKERLGDNTSVQKLQDFPNVLDTVIGNLKEMLSPDDAGIPLHPDVATLLAYTGKGTSDLTVAHPPMLLNSWRLLVEMSLKMEHDLIPIDSDVERISTLVVSSRPWMRWEAPKATTKMWQMVKSARRGLGGLIWDERLEVLPGMLSHEAHDLRRDMLVDAITDTVLTAGSKTNLESIENRISSATQRSEAARLMLSDPEQDNFILQRKLGQRLRLPRNKIRKMLNDFQSGNI